MLNFAHKSKIILAKPYANISIAQDNDTGISVPFHPPMNNNHIVVGIGEVLWDILPEGMNIGGAPANFAYHALQLGMQSYVVSAVGDDVLGKQISDNFRDKSLPSVIVTMPYPTGTVYVSIDNEGIPQYAITENVAWDNIPFTDELEDLARRTRAVCFGTLAQRSATTRATIHRFIDAIPHNSDTLIVFDANLRQNYYDRDIIEQSLTRCNILKINDEELCAIIKMMDNTDIRAQSLQSETISRYAARLINHYRLKMVIITCGTNGSYIFTPEATSFLPTPKVDVIDTVGAGDSFTAAIVACILKGMSVVDAHRKAVAVAAYVCTQSGAMPALPHTTISQAK